MYETLDRKTVKALADSMPWGESHCIVLNWLREHPDSDPIEIEIDSLGRLVAINE